MSIRRDGRLAACLTGSLLRLAVGLITGGCGLEEGPPTEDGGAADGGVELQVPNGDACGCSGDVVVNGTAKTVLKSGYPNNTTLEVNDTGRAFGQQADINLVKTRAGGPQNEGAIGFINFVNPGSASSDRRIAAISGTNAGSTSSGHIRFFTNDGTADGSGFRERMVIQGNGNVGISMTPQQELAMSHTLEVNGTAANSSGTWAVLSDRRLKRDIAPIVDALATVGRLQGVTFRWTDPERDAKFGEVHGLIAQDVEKVVPGWVETGPDGYKRLQPIGIDALLIEAIKGLSARGDRQREEIEALRAEVAALRRQAGSPSLDTPSAGRAPGRSERRAR